MPERAWQLNQRILTPGGQVAYDVLGSGPG